MARTQAVGTIGAAASFAPRDDVPETGAEWRVATMFEAGLDNLRQELGRRRAEA